jgi:hypothetical protein
MYPNVEMFFVLFASFFKTTFERRPSKACIKELPLKIYLHIIFSYFISPNKEKMVIHSLTFKDAHRSHQECLPVEKIPSEREERHLDDAYCLAFGEVFPKFNPGLPVVCGPGGSVPDPGSGAFLTPR